MSLVTTIINEMVAEFQRKITNIFKTAGILSIDEAEKAFRTPTEELVCGLLSQYYERLDEAIRDAKEERKAEGLIVERRGDRRSVLTSLGELRFSRTYYLNRKKDCYEYPVDKAAGLEGYERISVSVGEKLALAACGTSYRNAAKLVTDGKVSAQTVMNKVRNSTPNKQTVKRKTAKVLHIDADEDHVTLVGGKPTMVPLISVYEGIEKSGRRHKCKNIFHISEYGRKPQELWEQVLTEIERRYELDGTQIYLHGDGAKWIVGGLECFPQAKFVLDKYHKNKYLKELLGGLDSSWRGLYEKKMREALKHGDSVEFSSLAQELIALIPEREEKIKEAAGYLLDFIDAISICETDAEANNGGCTEPHVSNVLSLRLSNRPLAWSRKTLQRLAPMLASYAENKDQRLQRTQVEEIPTALATAARAASKAVARAVLPRNAAGLPSSESIGRLPVLENGKHTPLFQLLRTVANTL